MSEAIAFPEALRRWRTARRMSQLDLALETGVSARHLSFLETGRAQPSREMVLRLCDALVAPRAACNELLRAAGFAAVFPNSPLDAEALAPFRAVLADMMRRHDPYPALLCDRTWTLLDANDAARALLTPLQGASRESNIVRMLVRSPIARELIVNFAEVLDDMSARIRLEALEAGADDELHELLAEIESHRSAAPPPTAPRRPLTPVVIRAGDGVLCFLSTIAHFGTSEDVTVRDLRLELLFPADEATRARLLDAQAGAPAPARYGFAAIQTAAAAPLLRRLPCNLTT